MNDVASSLVSAPQDVLTSRLAVLERDNAALLAGLDAVTRNGDAMCARLDKLERGDFTTLWRPGDELAQLAECNAAETRRVREFDLPPTIPSHAKQVLVRLGVSTLASYNHGWLRTETWSQEGAAVYPMVLTCCPLGEYSVRQQMWLPVGDRKLRLLINRHDSDVSVLLHLLAYK